LSQISLTLLSIITLSMADPVRAVLLLTVEALHKRVSKANQALPVQTYALGNLVVHNESRGQRRHSSAVGGCFNRQHASSRMADTTVQNVLDRAANVRRNLRVVDHLNQELLDLDQTFHTKFMREYMGNTFNRPWLRARVSHSTASHALGLTDTQNARQALDVKTRREIVNGDQRDQ
jgi:hypothetical protein